MAAAASVLLARIISSKPFKSTASYAVPSWGSGVYYAAIPSADMVSTPSHPPVLLSKMLHSALKQWSVLREIDEELFHTL